MNSWMGALAAMCEPGGAMLPSGLLLAGLAGGVMHCAPMCGPFVLGQVGAKMDAASACGECRHLGILPGYHVGRIVTYTVLGAIAGLVGLVPGLGQFAGVALALAALLFLCQGLRQLAPAIGRHLPGAGQPPSTIMHLLRRLHRLTGVPLGLALGLLPCGLLYTALLAASAAGGALQGAAAMFLFGLGTVPALLAVGIAGQAAARRWQRAIGKLAPILLLINAAILGLMATQMF
jgi:sulfite exporter TauE/SafE